MKPRSILYHDVFEHSADESGFPGAAAARYKLDRTAFASHIAELSRRAPAPAVSIEQAQAADIARPFFFTVDDGGASCMYVADMLEAVGWRGCFFVTTNQIGAPAFMKPEHIRALAERGHSIGSHSASHPPRISDLGDGELQMEWRSSTDRLTDISQREVRTASVPGGYYSKRVAAAAAGAGIAVLFNSEPTEAPHVVDGCLVLGRYTVYGSMSAAQAGDLASGAPIACVSQRLLWNAKKAVKAGAAPVWESARRLLLR